MFDKLRRLGVQGTNVELNQIANRLTDFADISENNTKGLGGVLARNIVRLGSLGVSDLERKLDLKSLLEEQKKYILKLMTLVRLLVILVRKISFKECLMV